MPGRQQNDSRSSLWQQEIPALLLLLVGVVAVAMLGKDVKNLPALIWALLGCYAVWILRSPVVALAYRIQDFKAFGVEFSVAEEAFATSLREKAPERSASVARSTMARLKREADRLTHAEILWVDDYPSGNRNESYVLQSLGALVTFAASTDEALQAINEAGTDTPFQLVISDMSRGGDPDAGEVLLSEMQRLPSRPPVIFYVGVARDLPTGAFAITTLPDLLFEYILDALSWRRRER